jgi:hypothetical protein
MTESARRRYVFCALIELVGMVLILWDGVPLFRHLMQAEQVATLGDHAVLSIGAVLVQATYWTALRAPPPFDLPDNPFLAHVALFVSRLSFIFASGVFSVAVYRYSDVLDFKVVGSAIMMAALFSVFCFSRHLERIGLLMKP